MGNRKLTKKYKSKSKEKCKRCRHSGRDVKLRTIKGLSDYPICNNCCITRMGTLGA